MRSPWASRSRSHTSWILRAKTATSASRMTRSSRSTRGRSSWLTREGRIRDSRSVHLRNRATRSRRAKGTARRPDPGCAGSPACTRHGPQVAGCLHAADRGTGQTPALRRRRPSHPIRWSAEQLVNDGNGDRCVRDLVIQLSVGSGVRYRRGPRSGGVVAMGSLMAEVRGAEQLVAGLNAVLASNREELLIGLCNASQMGNWLMLAQECRLARDNEVRRDARGLHWTGELTSELHDEARRTGRGILLLHAHGGRDHVPGLSETDASTVDEILPHLGMLLPDVPHAYVVVNTTHATGWAQLGNERRALDRITLATNPLRTWTSEVTTCEPVHARDQRQAAALGELGIAKLRRSTVGIVGVGGAGSQVAEMLAHAGIGRLVVVDPDALSDVNLSRTHGASPETVGQLKVQSAKAMVERISPETEVLAVAEALPTKAL